MLKSFKPPVTLPLAVTHYYEPTALNLLALVGGSRTAHQMFLSHQIRLLNTVLGSLRGLLGKQVLEIAQQNRFLTAPDFDHLCVITKRLMHAEIIDESTKEKLDDELFRIFRTMFPDLTPKHLINSNE